MRAFGIDVNLMRIDGDAETGDPGKSNPCYVPGARTTHAAGPTNPSGCERLLKRGYREKMKQLHPDKVDTNPFVDSEQAEHRKIDAQEKLDSCKPTIDTAAAIRSRRISGTRRCSEVPVPGKNIGRVNGVGGSWTSWSLCNNLEIERERTCDSPAPKNQGHPCEGPSLQTAACGHHFR